MIIVYRKEKDVGTHIEELVNQKIEQIKNNENVFDTGTVIKIKDYIIEVSGLENVTYFEKVIIWEKGMGYVNQINQNSVNVAIVKEYEPIMVGDLVKTTGESFKAVFTEEALGRVVDIFGTDLLTKKVFEKTRYINIENDPIPIMDRREVKRPMYTGIAGIDLIYPIGKGQRQLIIGDKKTGKTQICLDTIVNQRKNSDNIICIYIAVGKTKKEIKTIYNELLRKNALYYTMLVVATNDDKQPVVSLIPFVGLSIAEEYMKMKKDVIVVIDDLKKHADTYREISLVSNKTPGREAYPSDIFYLHARLLEKGCQYKNRRFYNNFTNCRNKRWGYYRLYFNKYYIYYRWTNCFI